MAGIMGLDTHGTNPGQLTARLEGRRVYRMRRTLGLLGLLAVVACGDATAPSSTAPLYADATVIPRDTFDLEISGTWRHMQECSGLTGQIPFTAITFYSVPRDAFPYGTLPDTGTAVGLFAGGQRQIYVAHLDHLPHSAAILDILRHEMMHALLYPISGHPPEWFGPAGPCGDLMNDGHIPVGNP